MKFNLPAIASFVVLITVLTSCNKDCQCTFYCPNGGCLPFPALSGVTFEGFNQHEMNSVNVKLYNPGTNFTDLTASFTTTGAMSWYDSNAAAIGDSNYVVTVSGHSSGKEKFDFYTTAPDIIIYLPEDNTTIKISNITTKPGWCDQCRTALLWQHFINSYFISNSGDTKGKTVVGQQIIITRQ